MLPEAETVEDPEVVADTEVVVVGMAEVADLVVAVEGTDMAVVVEVDAVVEEVAGTELWSSNWHSSFLCHWQEAG